MPFGIVPLVVNIPGGAPTGQVFNASSGFVVHSGSDSGACALHIRVRGRDNFGMEPRGAGSCSLDAGAGSRHHSGGRLQGPGSGPGEHGNRLYAANFSAGTIDVFDSHFMPVHRHGAFVDHRLPHGYAPFNIQELDGRLYVTYAKQDADKVDDVPGHGHGFWTFSAPTAGCFGAL